MKNGFLDFDDHISQVSQTAATRVCVMRAGGDEATRLYWETATELGKEALRTAGVLEGVRVNLASGDGTPVVKRQAYSWEPRFNIQFGRQRRLVEKAGQDVVRLHSEYQLGQGEMSPEERQGFENVRDGIAKKLGFSLLNMAIDAR